jgi:CheY-like chemotaxis protein
MYALKILIVEDELIFRQYLQGLLEDAGCTIIGKTADGLEAVEIAGRTQPDLVFMDIEIKGGIDGVEAAMRISSAVPTFFVFLSSYNKHEVYDIHKVPGCIAFIDKPPKQETICNILHMVRGDTTSIESKLNFDIPRKL